MTEILQLLQSNPPLFIGMSCVLGLTVGSFLNVVIHRLPRMMEIGWQQQCVDLGLTPVSTSTGENGKAAGDGSNRGAGDAAAKGQPVATNNPYNLIVPHSACPHCNHAISALENVPVLSYLLLRGKCKACGAPISPRYPIVETTSAALCGYAAYHFGFGWAVAGAMLFVWALLALTFIDFDTQLLPDDITLPLLWIGLLFNLNGVFTSLENAVVGAMCGYLVLWCVYWLFKLVTGKEGMGYGDFKLLAALGAWLGWKMLPLMIMLSSLVGAVVGIALIVAFKHGRNIPIPFGPYLAGGGLIALFWGQSLTQSYLQLLAVP